MSDIIKLYNPANASALTPEDIAGLQKLDSAQIKQLAQAYPNMAYPKAYLLIFDSTKPIEKQILVLSTYENLWNLIVKNAQKQYKPYGFRGSVKQRPASTTGNRPRRSEVLDLSETELMSLPGFRTDADNRKAAELMMAGSPAAAAPEISKGLQLPEEVKVTKIKKTPKSKK